MGADVVEEAEEDEDEDEDAALAAGLRTAPGVRAEEAPPPVDVVVARGAKSSRARSGGT